jgi:hypothetical protein
MLGFLEINICKKKHALLDVFLYHVGLDFLLFFWGERVHGQIPHARAEKP